MWLILYVKISFHIRHLKRNTNIWVAEYTEIQNTWVFFICLLRYLIFLSCFLFTWSIHIHHESLSDLYISNLFDMFIIKTSTVVYANEVGAHYCYVKSIFICKCFRLEKLVFSGSNKDVCLTMRIVLILYHIVCRRIQLIFFLKVV